MWEFGRNWGDAWSPGGGFPIILKNQADFSCCFPRFRSKVYRMNCRGKFDRCQNQMKPGGIGWMFFVGVLGFLGVFFWKCLELLKVTFSSSVVITICSEPVLYFFPTHCKQSASVDLPKNWWCFSLVFPCPFLSWSATRWPWLTSLCMRGLYYPVNIGIIIKPCLASRL